MKVVVEWHPWKTRTSTSFLVPEVNTAHAASPGKCLLSSSASQLLRIPCPRDPSAPWHIKKSNALPFKERFLISANPCSFLLYLLPPLRIYVSNSSVFVSHLWNVGSVFFICPYYIQAGRGANPSWDYCDTQLYLENPLSQHLAPG